MLTNEQQEFYDRWTAKAAATTTKTIADYIDKFMTLFIAYNALYHVIPEKLAAADHEAVSNRDKEGATTNVLLVIDPAQLLAALSASDNDKDIAELTEILQVRMFQIKFTMAGLHDPAEDATLETDLASANPATKALALLKVIYYVRCNIFHGRKDLQPYQDILVQPIVNILSSLNGQLYSALLSYPH
jgi:hypothetical protein